MQQLSFVVNDRIGIFQEFFQTIALRSNLSSATVPPWIAAEVPAPGAGAKQDRVTLRRAWFNLDLIWAAALVVTGVVTFVI